MSRLSIYAGQQGALKSFERRYPLVLGGAWRAPDGDVAVALASIACEPLTVPLVLEGEGLWVAQAGKQSIVSARQGDGRSAVSTDSACR